MDRRDPSIHRAGQELHSPPLSCLSWRGVGLLDRAVRREWERGQMARGAVRHAGARGVRPGGRRAETGAEHALSV